MMEGRAIKSSRRLYDMRRWNRDLPYFLFLGLGIVIIVSFSFLALLMTIRYNIGPFKVNEILRTMIVREGKVVVPDVALYEPTTNRDMVSKNYGYDSMETAIWFKLLKEAGIQFSLIGDEKIENEELADFKVILIPQGLYLTKKEKKVIKSFAARGGGVIAAGLIGAMDETGRMNDFLFMKELFGITYSGSTIGEPFVSLYPLPGKPLSTSLALNVQIECLGDFIVPATSKSEPHAIFQSIYEEGKFLRYMDAYLSAINMKGYRKGRVAWFGFPMTAAKIDKENYPSILTMVKNSIDWVMKRPLAGLDNWPLDRKSCIGLAILLEPGEFPSDFLLKSMNDWDIQPTFVASVREGDDDYKRAEVISRHGDVVVRDGDSIPFWKREKEEMENRVRFLSGWSENEGKGNIKGIMLEPGQEMNPLSLIEDPIYENRFNYIIYSGDLMRKAPFRHEWFYRGERRSLFLFSEPEIDAYSLLREHKLYSHDEFFKYVQRQLDVAEKVSSLVQFTIHHSIFLTHPDYYSAFEKIINEAKERGFWITSYRNIYKWLMNKENISLSIKELKPNRAFVSFMNFNDEDVRDLTARLFMPQTVSGVNFISEQLGVGSPRVMKIAEATVTINIPVIKARSAIEYTVDYR